MPMIIDGTNGGFFPSWTTATRPASPAVGQMGYNTTTGLFDQYTASGWVGSLTNASQSIPKSALPTGSVLQVVSVQYNTQTATSSATYSDTGLQASITPTSATSRIFVLATLGGFELTAAAQAAYFNFTRDATQIFQPNGFVGYPNGALRTFPAPSFMFLDSPATTSSTTYKVRFFTASALGALTINVNGSQSSITLMEIAT